MCVGLKFNFYYFLYIMMLISSKLASSTFLNLDLPPINFYRLFQALFSTAQKQSGLQQK